MYSFFPLYLSRESFKNITIDEFPPNTLSIGFNPYSNHFLKKNKIRNEDTYYYFSIEGHEYVSKHTNTIISSFEHILNQQVTSEFTDAYKNFFLFNLKFFYSFLLSNLFIIHEALKKNNLHSIYSIQSLEDLNSLSFPENKEAIFYNLVSSYCESNEVEKLYLELNYNLNEPNILREKISDLFNFLYLSLAKLRIKNSQAYIVVPDDSYNMANLKKIFLKNNPELRFINLRHKQGGLKEKLYSLFEKSTIYLPIERKHSKSMDSNFLENLNKLKIKFDQFLDENTHSTLTHFGVNLTPLTRSFIFNFLENDLSTLNGLSKEMQEHLDLMDISMTMAQHSLGFNGLLGEYSTKKGIQGMLISHGSHVFHKDPIAEVEWQHHSKNLIYGAFSKTAIQTPITQRFIRNNSNKSTHYCNTGPLLFHRNNSIDKKEHFKRKFFNLDSQVRLITHIGTPKPFETFRPWIYETIDEYIFNINQISEFLEQKSDILFAIRFRANKWLSADEFSSRIRKSNNSLIVSNNISLYSNLKSSDLMISYSSTVIEEALELQIPVATYDSQRKYDHLKYAHKGLNSSIYVHLHKISELESLLFNLSVGVSSFDALKKEFEVDLDIPHIVSNLT